MKKKTESEPMTAEEQKIRGLIGRPTKKELERMYLDIWEENKSLKQQLDGKLEESKEYQSMVKRLRDEAQLKQIAVNQLNRLKEKYDKLKTSTDENSQKLTEATLEHDEKDTADKVEILSLREQLEAKDKEIDRLKKALNNNQTELDASVIAQKAHRKRLNPIWKQHRGNYRLSSRKLSKARKIRLVQDASENIQSSLKKLWNYMHKG